MVIDKVQPAGAKLAVLLMFPAGLRPSEVVGLTWGRVDLAALRITVAETHAGGGSRYTDSGQDSAIQQPKWRARSEVRVVPITQHLADLLAPGGPAGEPVCATNLEGPYSVAGLDSLWQRARKAVGEGWSADTLDSSYALRHTHASLALNAGIPSPEVASRLGHSPDTLLKV